MKKFWTFKKHRRSDGRKIPPLKTDGTLHSEQPEKADILNGPFQKLFQKKNSISNGEFQKQCKMTGKFNTIKDINVSCKHTEYHISISPWISKRIILRIATD